jgi:ribosomal-protein-alanine N-acetyltransferase
VSGRVILETERLILREMTEDDAHDVYLLTSNPKIQRYLSGERMNLSPEEALNALRTHVFPQYAKYGIGRWAVVPRHSSTLIGWAGLKFMPEDNEYDLGYRFLEEHWGKGYATESATAVLEYGLKKLPGARIVGKAVVGNVASIRVLQKIGMKFERNEPCGEETCAVYVRGFAQELSTEEKEGV